MRNKTSRLRVATFITCIDKEALEVHNGLPFQSDEEKADINKVLELWANHCIEKTNIIYERYKFNNRSQKQTETIDTYITTLRALAETCEFGTLKDELIRDRIVCGVRDKGIRRKLLQECGLTLSKCVDICRANEATAAQLKDMAPSQTTEQGAKTVNQKESSKKPKTTKEKSRDPKDQLSAECKYCGYKHERKRDKCPEETERIHAVDFLPISEPQLAEIQRETAADSVLQSLIQVILQGWPDQKEALPSELHPYFTVRDELTAQDGTLFKGLRCVVPSSLRPKIRERLHGAHTGVEGCLRRARETVYWPGLNADLRDYIAKCGVCATYQKDQQKEPLISHKIPNRPCMGSSRMRYLPL